MLQRNYILSEKDRGKKDYLGCLVVNLHDGQFAVKTCVLFPFLRQ